MNATVLTLLAATLYCVATLAQWRSINSESQSGSRLPLLAGGLAGCLHALALSTVADKILALDVARSLSLTMLGASLLVILISIKRPLHLLMLVVWPITALTLIISLHDHQLSDSRNTMSRGLLSHIGLSMTAFIVLTVATLQAAILDWQNRQLKQHQFARPMRMLPPLQTTERLLFDLIWFGIGLLTLAIVTGSLYVDNLFSQKVAHKTVFTLLSWLLFATLLWGRSRWGWRGQRAARLTLLGSGLLFTGFIGSKFVLEFVLATSSNA